MKNIDRREIILNILECKKYAWSRSRGINRKRKDRLVNRIFYNWKKIEQAKASRRTTG